MNTKEFAKYVIDNIGRATLGNSLKIADKIDNVDFYSFEDYVKETNEYVSKVLVENKLPNIKCYHILSILDTYYKKYVALKEKKYNKTFIINDLIIDLWKVINGD